MRDSIWNGVVQRINFNDETSKGMKKILEERGVNTIGMKENTCKPSSVVTQTLSTRRAELNTCL